MPASVLNKISSLTADDRYPDAWAFCIFNPPETLFSMKELGAVFNQSICCYDDLNWKK